MLNLQTIKCDHPFSSAGSKTRYSFLYLLFGLLLILCYGNTFHADWHFDDIANILLNDPLHLTSITPTSIWQTFFAYPEHTGKIMRPVSNLTFALNWFFGQDRVIGYHLVNLFIHFLTTVLLFHSCLLLLKTPAVREKYPQSDNHHSNIYIAGLAAILWAVNPVQTQAVTYIVQRMASLAAMFYIAGILCYLKGRLAQGTKKKSWLYYALAVLFYLLSVGSKENGVLLPASLMLIEFIFFQPEITFNKKTLLAFCGGLLAIVLITLFFTGPGFFLHLLSSYSTRNFTLSQRILTETRIIIHYLSLLLFPDPSRLSITYDIRFSTSLFSPPTTLTSIVLLVSGAILSLRYHKRYPVPCFAVLFFLLNHVTESTIIPLELIFEHRNYLPSFFLFLPFAVWAEQLISRFGHRQPLIRAVTTSVLIMVILLFSLGTMTRNKVWATEESLWRDSLAKAPDSVRSYINLGHVYLFEKIDLKKAFELNYLSLDKQSPTPWKDRLRAYNNMAYIMNRIGNYQKALQLLDAAQLAAMNHNKSNLFAMVSLYKAQTLWLVGNTQEAMECMAELVAQHPDNPKFLLNYGEMLIADNQISRGINLLHKTLQNSSSDKKPYKMALLDLSLAYEKMGQLEKSLFFSRFALKLQPPPIPTALCILEHNLRQKKFDKADHTFKVLLAQATWPELMVILNKKPLDFPIFPLDYALIREYAHSWIDKQKE